MERPVAETYDVVIIGAGIAGLACAHRLHSEGLGVLVLEAQTEVGGSLRSSTMSGATIDLGPQTVHSRDPLLFQHLAELGLEEAMTVAGSNGRKRFIVLDGRLVELPSSPLSAIHTKALSWRAKWRVLGEPFAPAGPGGDESAAEFVARRLGPEVADHLLDPFVSGVHAGDPHTLSMRGAFPRLLDAEQEHGSLVRWALYEGRSARRRRRGRGKSRPERVSPRLFSFQGGLQRWPQALAQALGPNAVRTHTPAHSLHKLPGGRWAIEAEGGLRIEAGDVVIATPASAAAHLLEPVSSGGARVLHDMPYSPVATVHQLYRRHAIRHPLDGFGLLVPTREHRPVLGILWVSSLFEGRAPEGTVLTTSFVGGARSPERVTQSDGELADAVQAEHAALLGASEAPVATRVCRWSQAIPRVEFGHVDRLATLTRMQELNPGIHLAGSYAEGGAAVPKCWERGREVARRILDRRASQREHPDAGRDLTLVP